MGEGYYWVNVRKKEYIVPYWFDLGYKTFESRFIGNHLLGALYNLLSSDWKDDDIVWLGEDINIEESETNPVLRRLYEERKTWDDQGTNIDYILEFGRDLSGLFKEAEKEVRKEIAIILDERDDDYNYFRIDYDDPYKGLFERESKSFRYTLNHTKKEYFDITRTICTYTRDGEEKEYNYNPLPTLMAYGRQSDTGIWLGDKIEVSDDPPPEEYTDKSVKYAQSLF